SISLAQPGHSVRLLKIIDESVPAVPPSVSIQAPNHAKVGETIRFAITADATGVPALSSRWDFGDGTTEQGRQVVHCYTKAGNYSVHLSAEGVEGVPAEKQASITVSGTAEIGPPIRYQEQEKNNSR
ncbi:MAG: PKD domain-containing protein, partial [Acidobacteria bacterium]|nr:PKD domain-containing protein [Acidobacteriota bacterium]